MKTYFDILVYSVTFDMECAGLAFSFGAIH